MCVFVCVCQTQVQEIRTHFMFNNFKKNHTVFETVEKCGRAGQMTI